MKHQQHKEVVEMSSSLCRSSNPRITPLPDLLKLFKPFSPDKFVELRNMLEDREMAIKMEWENLEMECHLIKKESQILERMRGLSDLNKRNFEEKMLSRERECEDLNQKISRLSKDEKMWSDRAKKAEENCGKVHEKLSVITNEKNREISELNKNMGVLNNQILERDQRIEMCELKLKNYEEKVAQIERDLQELKDQKLEFDRTMDEMEDLRRKNVDASETIGELRRQIFGVEMEKTRYDNTIKEMKQKLSDMEELKRQKLDAEEVALVNIKKLESLAPIITRMEEGLANIFKVYMQDMVNIIKSNETSSDATPSSKGEKENLGYGRMHACNGSLKTGSPKLPPQFSPIKEGNESEKNAENNTRTDRGKEIERSEGSDCIEVICIDDETSLGRSELSAISCEKEKMSEKFPITSFVIKRKRCDKKWLVGADMLKDFHEDEELCMNVVCVLYRQQISASKSTPDSYGGLSHSDALSVRALGEYLVDGGHGFLLGKSLSEVKQDRPDVVVECRRLATNYCEKLFLIYCNGEDPFFKLIRLYNLK